MFNFERDLFGRVTWQGEGEEQRERWRERPSVAASLPKYLQQLRLRYTNARNMGIHLVLICGLQELIFEPNFPKCPSKELDRAKSS